MLVPAQADASLTVEMHVINKGWRRSRNWMRAGPKRSSTSFFRVLPSAMKPSCSLRELPGQLRAPSRRRKEGGGHHENQDVRIRLPIRPPRKHHGSSGLKAHPPNEWPSRGGQTISG